MVVQLVLSRVDMNLCLALQVKMCLVCICAGSVRLAIWEIFHNACVEMLSESLKLVVMRWCSVRELDVKLDGHCVLHFLAGSATD